MTPLSWPRAIALHLLPGAAGFAVFAALAPPLHAAGLPPVWGMFAAVLLVLAPVELYLARSVPWSFRVSWRLLLPTFAAALLLPGLVQWLEPAVDRPSWWQLSPGDDVLTVVGWIVCFVVVGPIAEERYFRGHLLPRLPARGAPAANAGLFALYHLWQPWTWLTVAVFALPLAVAARRPNGLPAAVLSHVLVNLLLLAAALI
ncbi:CPBP family glutamic-type intramembrane protease [Dactylosporangium sp. CS-047395]|uniref:CPBP family glutamic-type intramembrane protease n=1 Tax=Dactylosporangium sp. CS-047395 TaxID=3239936 RepID=UPI003D918717